MNLRVILGVIIIVLAIIIAVISTMFPATSGFSALLLNLSTEGIGIAITVSIVDWLLEQREEKENIRRIAYELLDKIENVVWVWLGGTRYPNPARTFKLLGFASNQDELAPITTNLIIELATDANRYQTQYAYLLKQSDDFRDALHELSQLLAVRTFDGGVLLPALVEEQLELAMIRLCDYLQIDINAYGSFMQNSAENPTISDLGLDSDVKLQQWRATGKVLVDSKEIIKD